MDNSPVIDIAASTPRPEDLPKLAVWYSEMRVPMLMKYGVKSAEYFKALVENPDYPIYMNMYHYDNIRGYEECQSSQASAEISEDIQARWPNGYRIRWRIGYTEHKKWSSPMKTAPTDETVIHVVGVNGPARVKVAEFNEWYDNTHVPWLMKTQTIAESLRCQIIQPNKDYPTYLAVYYFANQQKYEIFLDHSERVAAVKELNEHWPNGIGGMWRVQYKMTKRWEK